MKWILLSAIAKKQYGELEKELKSRIKNELKGLKGREDLYRLRVGDYRIIYYGGDECIKVTQIIHRSRGYDWL